jgi:hypothetical protein
MHAVQELQESIWVNEEGVQEYINNETEGQNLTEEDKLKQEKTVMLSKRTGRQLLKRNSDFLR